MILQHFSYFLIIVFLALHINQYLVVITAWKFFGLDKTNKEKKIVSNECFVCKSGLCDLYKDLYDHDWNLNGSVTRSNVNARNISDDVTHSVAQIQVRAPTTVLIFRD